MVMVDRLHLRRFNVTQYHTMKRLGILPPNARVELLEGIVTDKRRPSPRELEVIAKLAEALATGLDTELHITEVLHEGLGDPKYAAPAMLKQLVKAGRLGRKSGAGFYDYAPK